ncbi:MAG TPA: ROK family protein [Saprospiraceae bacterium]|nr:ROK family protein [Saprospiraceae bacterium]
MSNLLGIDIGGTSVKLGLIKGSGQIQSKLVFPTQTLQSISHFFQVLSQHIEQLLTTTRTDLASLSGIGIGAPGHSTADGEIIGAVNLPFSDKIPIVSFLNDLTGLPVFLLKDAKVAALGEKYWGAAQGMDNFVILMLGTGLGYAAYSEGRIINGQGGLAGEFGHSIIQINGRSCNCGKQGCLETYLSATGLKRTTFELLGQDLQGSPLRQYTFAELNTKIIAELAQQGDTIAQQAFRQTAHYLGIIMANLGEQLGPEGFIISGGLAEAGAILLEPAEKIMNDYLQAVYRDKIKVLRASLPAAEVGILGAGALVMDSIQLQA